MPNETDTSVRQPALDETQELPAFPARPNVSSSAGGDSMIAAQYKALQEAQFLHEETLRQLRGEIQAQKQRIADMANEKQGSALAPAGLDAILLRLSELERKIGEDASDPLINEIAHRLAALESTGGRGPDSRIDRVSEQLEELRRRVSQPHTDPRTDEMALRIASVEGSLRRAQQAFDSDTLTSQIHELQAASRDAAEAASAELAELRRKVDEAQGQTQPDWSDKIDRIEIRLEAISESISDQSEIADLSARLAELERSETDDESAAQLQSLSAKVEALAAKLDDATDSDVLTDLTRKIADLENQIVASAPSVGTESLSARVDQLQEAIENQSASEAVQALQQRLAALESQAEQAPDAGEAIAELRQRCDALADRLAETPQTDIYDSRIAAIESKLDELPAGDSGVDELREKLATLEKAGLPQNDGRLAELTARLRALELQAGQAGSSVDDDRLERLSNRLDQLELTGGSSGLTNQINELRERVAGLTSQLREAPSGPTPEVLSKIDERLAQLESATPTALQRIEKLEQQEPVAASDQADAVAELRQRIDQLVNTGVSNSTDSATADILHELGMRVQALERNGDSGPGGSATALGEELNERIAHLEAKLASGVGSPRSELQNLADRLSYLEQSGAPSEGGQPTQFMEQLLSRYEDIDGRLAMIEESGAAGDAPGRAMTELAELRAQLSEIRENGGSPGIPENFIGKLAEKISSGIAGSEVKSIQTQMYVVYFFLALIGAMALSSFFMR